MAGRTVDEARAAWRATLPRSSSTSRAPHGPSRPHSSSSSHSSSAHVATSSPTVSSSSPSSVPILINGVQYLPDPSWNVPPSAATPSAYITEVNNPTDYPYRAFLALSDDIPTSLPASTALSASSTSSSLLDSPFILDSGATCHISPFSSDFVSIRSITPHPIKGLGGLSIDAIGVGDVTLRSHTESLILRDVFFVPQSSVRLVSIFLLNNPSSGAPYSTHFYSNHVYITDHTNSVIAQGSVLPNRKLYILSDFTLHVPTPPSSHSSAHYASRPPDVDCWHRRLGHCNPQTILSMARSHAAEGMPLDPSIAPPLLPMSLLPLLVGQPPPPPCVPPATGAQYH